LKAERDNAKVQAALSKITAVARTSENLMPHVIEAVKLYATVGEVTAALEEVFGRHRE
jgi:methylmalonyl-CoA mutase, N-terminal domain